MGPFIGFIIVALSGGVYSNAIATDQLAPKVQVEHVYNFNK